MGQNKILDFAHFESCASYFDKIVFKLFERKYLVSLSISVLFSWEIFGLCTLDAHFH